MANKDCTFYDATKVTFAYCGESFNGDQLAEAVGIPEIESIKADPTLSGTTYSAMNNRDYAITVAAVNGSDLHRRLEKAFKNRECCQCGVFDYNASSNLSMVSDSVVILKRGEMKVGEAGARIYTLHGRWSFI